MKPQEKFFYLFPKLILDLIYISVIWTGIWILTESAFTWPRGRVLHTFQIDFHFHFYFPHSALLSLALSVPVSVSSFDRQNSTYNVYTYNVCTYMTCYLSIYIHTSHTIPYYICLNKLLSQILPQPVVM
jgi:hypothetical protein